MREEHGEPDVVEVRQTFDDSLQARVWEEKVIRRLNAVKSQRWLNRQNGGKHFCASHSVEHHQRIAESNRGKIRTNESKQKMRDAKKGKPLSELHRKSIGDSNRGKTISKEHKRILSDKMKVRQRGDKNTQLGTRWITNGSLNRKIKKDESIPQGWRRGRIIVWFNETRSK